MSANFWIAWRVAHALARCACRRLQSGQQPAPGRDLTHAPLCQLQGVPPVSIRTLKHRRGRNVLQQRGRGGDPCEGRRLGQTGKVGESWEYPRPPASTVTKAGAEMYSDQSPKGLVRGGLRRQSRWSRPRRAGVQSRCGAGPPHPCCSARTVEGEEPPPAHTAPPPPGQAAVATGENRLQ